MSPPAQSGRNKGTGLPKILDCAAGRGADGAARRPYQKQCRCAPLAHLVGEAADEPRSQNFGAPRPAREDARPTRGCKP